MTWTAVCHAYTVHVNSLHGTLMQSTLIITSNWIAALYELAHAEMAYSPRSLRDRFTAWHTAAANGSKWSALALLWFTLTDADMYILPGDTVLAPQLICVF